MSDISILIIDENRIRAAMIEDSLRESGHARIAVINSMSRIVRRIEEFSPDVIVMDLGNPNRDLLEHMFRVSQAVRKPIAMFVDRSDETAMLAAIEAGVSAYVVDGLKKDRIKPILDLAIMRFKAFEKLRGELETAQQALAERKTIDRAKGILMKLKGIGEGDAYALLRDTAMRRNERMAEIAKEIIAADRAPPGGIA